MDGGRIRKLGPPEAPDDAARVIDVDGVVEALGSRLERLVLGFSGYSGQLRSLSLPLGSGPRGDSGTSGFSGFSGTSGYSGFSSASGFSGISGYSGASGFSGI